MSATEQEVRAAWDAAGSVPESAIKRMLAAVEPLIRQRIAQEVEADLRERLARQIEEVGAMPELAVRIVRGATS